MGEEAAASGPGRREPTPWLPAVPDSTEGGGSLGTRPNGRWFLPASWQGEPLALYVWGAPRAVVNRVVFGMSRCLDPSPLWVELLEGDEEPDAVRLGWVPRQRAFVSHRIDDLETSRAVANMALWSIVRSDEPSRMLAELTDFVRLPPLIQEVLGETPGASARRAIAVGNADRVEHLFRDRSDDLRWLLGYLKGSGASLVVGLSGTPGVNGQAFDAEFHVDGAATDAWGEGTLTCIRGGSGAGFPVGARTRLGAIAELQTSDPGSPRS